MRDPGYDCLFEEVIIGPVTTRSLRRVCVESMLKVAGALYQLKKQKAIPVQI